MKTNVIYNEDCVGNKGMCILPDKSIDMILCDLPYGTTACSWDVIIPFEVLWKEYKRIIKDNGAIVLTASEPFASYLRLSNIKGYKYDWIWNKKLAGNGILVKYQPLKIHEIVCIFNSNIYFPKMIKGRFRKKMGLNISEINGGIGFAEEKENSIYYPVSIQEFSLAGLRASRIHPTQKPVELFEYLIKTYTKENEIVLDNCIGSGTTAIACINTNRKYIGFEKDKYYFDMANKRINFESNIDNIAENLSSEDFKGLLI